MDIMEKMTKLVSDYKGCPVTMDKNTTFEDLDFDSLDTVDLMIAAEDEFDIKFDEDMQAHNLGELILHIEQLQAKKK